jgi:UPF0755 protein
LALYWKTSCSKKPKITILQVGFRVVLEANCIAFINFKNMKTITSLPLWAKLTAGVGAAGLVGVLGYSAWWHGETAAAGPTDSPKVTFTVPNGSSAQSIGKKLAAQNLIKSELAWKLWTSQQSGGAKAGSYQISSGETLSEIGAKIWSGKVTEVSFIVKPGSRYKKMATYFEQEKKFFSAADFIAAVENVPRDKFPWLPAEIKNVEGFLYPDTYNTPKEGITAQGIVSQMLKQFEKNALPLYKSAENKSGLSLLQWVSLASIVEKEAAVAAERGKIAGVFFNRLKQNIPLGSDPTAEYAFNLTQTADRPLTFAEVKRAHPYNTYVTPGITPGPIASPSLGSLQAVNQPEGTDMLFFVARHDRTHVFSRTNAEHERATREIRESRQQKKKQAASNSNN